jgi:hypothetical protein
MIVNSPIESQAMLLRSWLEGRGGAFAEKNRRKFNQKLNKPLEIDLNPYRNWSDKVFSREQIDYLFYWREAAYEIEDINQREVFWSAVYAIMSYWLSNRVVDRNPVYEPDEIMHRVLGLHRENIGRRECELTLLQQPFETVEPSESSLTIFPLVFSDEEDDETQLQCLYHAWFHGHADVDLARRDIRNKLHKYFFSFTGKTDFTGYLQAASESKSVAISWTGKELPPVIHEQQIIEPFKKEFSGLFSRSSFSIKTISQKDDIYDFLLLFFN